MPPAAMVNAADVSEPVGALEVLDVFDAVAAAAFVVETATEVEAGDARVGAKAAATDAGRDLSASAAVVAEPANVSPDVRAAATVAIRWAPDAPERDAAAAFADLLPLDWPLDAERPDDDDDDALDAVDGADDEPELRLVFADDDTGFLVAEFDDEEPEAADASCAGCGALALLAATAAVVAAIDMVGCAGIDDVGLVSHALVVFEDDDADDDDADADGVGLALQLTRGSICRMSTSGSLIRAVMR